MLEKLNLTQEQLSKKVSKSRSHITNMLGLLRLPKEVQDMIINNKSNDMIQYGIDKRRILTDKYHIITIYYV